MQQNFCTLCPRECRVNRNTERGFCGAPKNPLVAKWMLHNWEEPAICYDSGSGAIFFSGCQLKCVFCQNYEISDSLLGKEMAADALCDLYFLLQEKGACNINLISATPYLETIIDSLAMAKKKGLLLPVVFNSGGYEKKETIHRLDGLVDIYLPDFKFQNQELSRRYASAKDYSLFCTEAIIEMQRQTGKPLWENDRLKRGVIVRHLVLPGCSKDSAQIIDKLSGLFGKDGIVLSLMSQYFPTHKAIEFSELNRKVTALEYRRVVEAAEKAGFEFLYTQKKESATSDFVPDFSRFCPDIN